MKKFAGILLFVCMCLGLAACGSTTASTAPAATAAPAPAAEAPAAEAPAAEAPAAEATAAEAPAANAAKAHPLDAVVAALNEEQAASQTADSPIKVRYEVGGENTIYYKITFEAFDVFAMMAEAGETGAVDTYNSIVAQMVDAQKIAQEEIEKQAPGVNVILRLCTNDKFNHTIISVENGAVVYDRVNKIGSVPADDDAVVTFEDMPPELQEAILSGADNSNN